MNTNLAIIESGLSAVAGQLAQVLPPQLPVERLIRTVLVSIDMNPALAGATQASIMRSAMSAAVLGLEVDGVTGQGYLVPFKGKAQFLPGYKGLVTVAARSLHTLEGFVVREGDGFEFDEPGGVVVHKRKLGNEADRVIVAAYAISKSPNMPQQVRVMSIDQIIETRNASAGYKARGNRSTWATDFAAMARKTPMRMLSNDLPCIPLHQAAALETQHDLGRAAYIEPDGVVVVDPPEAHTPQPAPSTVGPDTSAYELTRRDGSTAIFSDFTSWKAGVDKVLAAAGNNPDHVGAWWKLNQSHVERHMDRHPEVGAIIDRVQAALS